MNNVFLLTLDTLGKQIMFYIFALLTFALVLYALYNIVGSVILWLKTGGKIKIKDSEVGSSTLPALIKPKHSNCPHVGDVMQVIAKTSEFYALKASLPIELLNTQMQYVNEKSTEVRAMMLAIFVKELDNSVPVDVEIVHHPEYSAYCATLLALEAHLKDFIKIAFTQNHFLDYEGTAWTEKKERYCTSLMAKSTELLNLYWRGVLVSRGVLYSIHYSKEYVGKFEQAIHSMFDYARSEAIRTDRRIKSAEQEFKSWISTTITG